MPTALWLSVCWSDSLNITIYVSLNAWIIFLHIWFSKMSFSFFVVFFCASGKLSDKWYRWAGQVYTHMTSRKKNLLFGLIFQCTCFLLISETVILVGWLCKLVRYCASMSICRLKASWLLAGEICPADTYFTDNYFHDNSFSFLGL